MAKVLLVDDDPDLLEIRQLVLETTGHSVICARSREQAVEMFSKSSPDIVCMDVRIPRREDGVALASELRGLSASVPILVLSGWPDDIENSPSQPLVDRVLRKPVRTEALLSLIERLTA